jgi:cellulose synthase/poly-beta-1,6-N-acetylglucosamine synthase-like glycosyltransferase
MTNSEVPFFIVLARDSAFVSGKMEELERLGLHYIVVCGEKLDKPGVVYRPAIGKYDAINFAMVDNKIPEETKIVAFNDVDTRISGFEKMMSHFKNPEVGIVFAAELVREGPQRNFFTIFNPLRRLFPLAASGELMMIKREVLCRILPLKPCKAEDTYIMFKAIELGYRVIFCEDCFAETERTKTSRKEEIYKRKTVAGIYQAISFTRPPPIVRFLYTILPFAAILFVLTGRDGYHTLKGIWLGYLDFIRGDRSGTWNTRAYTG